MSIHEYMMSQKVELEGYPFYALIMAAMRQADDVNLDKLRSMWPNEYAELRARYNAPGGVLHDHEEGERTRIIESWKIPD